MTSTHAPFELSLTTATPVILNHHLTLDALLGAAIFRRTGSLEKALSEIPLTCTDGLMHGSVLHAIEEMDNEARACVGDGNDYLSKPIAVTRVPYIRSLAPVRDMDDMMPYFAGDPIKKIRDKGPYANLLHAKGDAYKAVAAIKFVFFGHGDMDQVENLIRCEIQHIGAKRGGGFGLIETIEVNDTAIDLSVFDGAEVMRPVPLSLAGAFGVKPENHDLQVCAWQAPYWGTDAKRTFCVCPKPVIPGRLL